MVEKLALYIQLVYTSVMPQSTVFKNNKSQAIRLPKGVAFPEHVKKVEITKQGDSLLITPVATKKSWEEFFSTPGIDEDFLKDRDQPPMQERDWDAE